MPTTNKLSLTQAVIDKLTPSRTPYWDDRLSGFGCRVSPKGKKVYFC